MKDVLTSFTPGAHVGLIVEAPDESAFLNEIINIAIEGSDYLIDEEVVELEGKRAERDLREGLKVGMKSVGAFCYINDITEDQLEDFCKANLIRTALENALIYSIAEIESISVSDNDIATYKKEYRDQYVRTLLNEPDFGEDQLKEALLARKVLNFLNDNNTWIRKTQE